MTVYFVDTSALVKRYITEIGSNWVQTQMLTDKENVVVICELTTIEFFSALGRRQREGAFTPDHIQILQNAFLEHYQNEYLTVKLEHNVLSRARELITTYPLRTLDAIQLASAVDFYQAFQEPVTFVSADNNLLAIAAREGFITDNPLFYQGT